MPTVTFETNKGSFTGLGAVPDDEETRAATRLVDAGMSVEELIAARRRLLKRTLA